ncbi:MAG: redoxin domain-containing protein [Bacteroidales bacterium]|nr:redoxin domain-containing protein [Bacteroidales bacterium]MCF8404150.1 redoxin domain-containing protein [Bacteroidales bacterium]
MKKCYFLAITILASISTFSQDYKLEILVNNLPSKEVYLADFYGDKNTIIDTVVPDTAGRIIFELLPEYHVGMYRVFFNKEVFLDILFNKEDIRIQTDYQDLYESLEVLSSKENQLYYDYLKIMHEYRLKLDLLSPLNDYYPRADSFFHIARAQFIGVQAEALVYTNDLIEQFPDTWVAKIAKLKKPLFYDPSLDEIARRAYQVEHYFDNFDFTDVDLIRTNVYTTAAIEYMSLYSNPNLNQDQLQDEFIKAVDKIMYEAMDNSIIYEFIVEYLVGGFERYHFDKVLDYIAETYSPEQCENEERKTDLETRLKKYAELSVGKDAPEIILPNDKGEMVKLSKIKSEYTLVIFWASWCPHCNETLPDVHDLYLSSMNSGKVEVITVSIDTKKEEWEKALAEGNYTWINASDLKGWDSPAAVDYNVYATPTMFLLDKDKKIVAKPITFNELKKVLIEKNIIK